MKDNAYKNLPKLPPGSYKKSPKEFAKIMKQFDPEMIAIYLKHYKRIRRMIKEGHNDGRHILDELQKMEIIELAGRFFSPAQILEIIREEWNTKYSPQALNKFLKNNVEVIREKRTKYKSNTSSLRLFHERARIEELTDIYYEYKEERDKNGQLNSLKEIRAETKGDKLTIQNNNTANINIHVKNHLFQHIDIKKIKNLAMLTVLQKHNLEPEKFMHRLVVDNKVRDDEGKILDGKKLPIEVNDNNIKNEKQLKKERKKEDEKVDIDKVKKIKQKLKERILEEKKKLDNIKNEADCREEEQKIKKDPLSKKRKKTIDRS